MPRFEDKPLREKRCENCAHFEAGVPPVSPASCHINPPNMLVGGNGGIAGVWIPVRKEDWCAHHKVIEN